MRRLLLGLCASLLGCDDVFLDLHPGTSPLGEGLTGNYLVRVATCDPGDRLPGCDFRSADLEAVQSSGGATITGIGGDSFDAFGDAAGDSSVKVAASGMGQTFELPVVPIAHSRITWFDRSHRFGPFRDKLQVELGPVFAGSDVELWQKHYSFSEEALAEISVTELGDVLLHGRAPFSLKAGETESTLVELPDRRPFRNRVALQAGDILGSAELSTEVGGMLRVEVVDVSAVHSLAPLGYNDVEEPEPLARWYGTKYVTVLPRDAKGRAIAGCPAAAGLEIADEEGIFEFAPPELRRTPFCEVAISLRDDQEWRPTTLVFTWGGAELRLTVEDRYY